MSPRRAVIFIVNGEEHSTSFEGSTTLGNAKLVVLDETRACAPLCPPEKWQVRDPQGFLLNESTPIGDMVDRDGVKRVFLVLPTGSGGG